MVVLKNGSFSFIFFREYRPGKFVLRYSIKETRFGLKITFITKGEEIILFCLRCLLLSQMGCIQDLQWYIFNYVPSLLADLQ